MYFLSSGRKNSTLRNGEASDSFRFSFLSFFFPLLLRVSFLGVFFIELKFDSQFLSAFFFSFCQLNKKKIQSEIFVCFVSSIFCCLPAGRGGSLGTTGRNGR